MNTLDKLDRVEKLLALAGGIDPTDDEHIALLERRDALVHTLRKETT
jgi:hypothetical protein